jgi:hypothetical protein
MSAVQGDDVHVSRPICLCVVLCVAALLTGSAETAAQPGVDPFAKKIRDMQAEMYKHMGQQKYFLARRQGMKIVKALQRKRGAGHQETLTAMMTAASMFTVTGDYTTAERLYREVLQQKQRQHGRDSFEAVTAEQALAGVFWARQELDKVAAIYARVSSVYRTKFGADSDMYANTLMTQAALHVLGRRAAHVRGREDLPQEGWPLDHPGAQHDDAAGHALRPPGRLQQGAQDLSQDARRLREAPGQKGQPDAAGDVPDGRDDVPDLGPEQRGR